MTASKKQYQRHGTTLLLVVVCMVVLTLVFGAMFRGFNLANRQIKHRNRKSQATLLAESGIERAVFALQADPDYQSETWKVTAEELGGRFAGQVEIKVAQQPDANQADLGAWIVSVKAIYPVESEFRATVSKQVDVVRRSERESDEADSKREDAAESEN